MSWTRRALLIGGSAAALGCGGLGTPKRRSKPVPEEAPPGRGQMRELKDRVNGLDRTAQLYVPSRYDPDTPTPIVLGTHGRGGTSRTVYSGFGWREACERHGWLGLFPYSGREVRTESNDNAWFDHLLTRCSEEFNIDRARVWGVALGDIARVGALEQPPEVQCGGDGHARIGRGSWSYPNPGL